MQQYTIKTQGKHRDEGTPGIPEADWLFLLLVYLSLSALKFSWMLPKGQNHTWYKFVTAKFGSVASRMNLNEYILIISRNKGVVWKGVINGVVL